MISTNIIFHRPWRVTCRSVKKQRISARHERVESERERDDEVDCGRRTARKDSTVSGLSHAQVESGKSRMRLQPHPITITKLSLSRPWDNLAKSSSVKSATTSVSTYSIEQGFPLDAVIDELRPSLIGPRCHFRVIAYHSSQSRRLGDGCALLASPRALSSTDRDSSRLASFFFFWWWWWWRRPLLIQTEPSRRSQTVPPAPLWQ